jgi:hypothetical protein
MLYETPPTGPVVEADPPIAVRVRVRSNKDTSPYVFERAWAMAWTPSEVLVFFRVEGPPHAITLWVPAREVRRR